MSALERRDREGEYRCRRSERQAGVEEEMALKQKHAVLQEIRALTGNLEKMSENWSDVNTWKSTDYKMGCTLLDSLKFADQGLRETSQERVAIVHA